MVLVSDKPMNSIVLTGLIVMVMHFLQTGRKRHTLPGTEEPMITLDFITALFYQVDEQMRALPKHPEAHGFLIKNLPASATPQTCLDSQQSLRALPENCSR